MPEQKHYPNPILNNGYVYTNLSKDVIHIVQEDMDYIVQNKAKRIDEYIPIALDSSFVNTRLTRNRLSSKFRKCLFDAAKDLLGLTNNLDDTNGEPIVIFNKKKLISNFIEIEIEKIVIPIPKDVELAIKEGATRVEEKEKFAKTTNELNVLFRQFCRDHVGGYAKVDSTPVLEIALKILFEDFLNIDEFQAIRIILFEHNKPKFIQLIDLALEKHEALLREKAAKMSKRVEHTQWDVPEERIFNEYYQFRDVDHHALEPFYEYTNASRPEREFVSFLEKHKTHIEWWYKNGDKNKEDFAVTYEDVNGVTRGFYVDFVIKLKNGEIALFDTKTLDSDPNFVRKHNALYKYLHDKSTKEKPLIGGIIVPRSKSDYSVWKYAENLIDKANDTTGWVAFDPSLIN
jgi:type III restriction enzyme